MNPESSPYADLAENNYHNNDNSCIEEFNLIGLIGLQTGNHFVRV